MSEKKMPQETLFIQHFKETSRSIKYYLENMHGYQALQKAFSMTPEKVTEEVKTAQLRGRGGAGFPTGVKWGFIPKTSTKPKILICNADESEPGTFKDRDLMRYTPYLLIEGMSLAAYAIGAHQAYIYIRGEYVREAQLLEEAIEVAYQKGYLGKNILNSGFDIDITVHRGAGAYICGEETALLNSLEGKRGEPRFKPPFPAISGAFGAPTVVNNVETLCAVPFIIRKGGAWFANLGRFEKSGGTRLYCLSGQVKKPGLYEFPVGWVSLKELIFEYGGGVLNDEKLKAVIPGGSSSPVLKADEIDIPLDIEPMMKAGSMLGSAAIIVISESYSIVRAIRRIAQFYAHESCGQCTPCREGCTWMLKILKRIENKQASMRDLDLLADLAGKIEGHTICAFGEAAAWPVKSFLLKFRSDFEVHIQGEAYV